MSEKEKQQLVSEVNILRELNHKYVVKYYDRVIGNISISIAHILVLALFIVAQQNSQTITNIEISTFKEENLYRNGVLCWWGCCISY